jgi:CheY-like chemotaxis protein
MRSSRLATALDALHKLEDYQPDFAIVDAMMPLMDGYQLCEAVRRHQSFKAIPCCSSRPTAARRTSSGDTRLARICS